MKDKNIKDMTPEEIIKELDLVSRGDDKARVKNLSEKTQTIMIEKEDYSAIIETDIDSDVKVEIIEETDAEFGRRVRFNLKVESFREQQAKRAEEEAKKPIVVKKFKAFKENLNKISCEALDKIIERLSRV